MGLFKKKPKEPTRQEVLDQNANVPFSTQFKEVNSFGDSLRYLYENIEVEANENAAGMKVGAVVYLKEDASVRNVVREQIGKVKPQKVAKHIKDAFYKMEHTNKSISVSARVSDVSDGLKLNIAFYQGADVPDYDEEEE